MYRRFVAALVSGLCLVVVTSCSSQTPEEEWTEDLNDDGVPMIMTFEQAKTWCNSSLEDALADLTPYFGSEEVANRFMAATYDACLN